MANQTLASRDGYLYLAKVAEQTERYEEMLNFMEKVVGFIPTNEEPTVEERTLLLVAYKHVIGARRGAWMIISSIEKKKELTGNEDHVDAIKVFKSKIETEISEISDGILGLLNSRLIPCSFGGESMVFYLRMKGDCHRYLAEIKSGAQRNEAAESAHESYKSAQDIANVVLAPTHPSRLGLALNFSVFYYDILNSHNRAYSIAKQAYDEANAVIDALKDSDISILILHFLFDNLTLWTPDTQEEDGDGSGEIKESNMRF